MLTDAIETDVVSHLLLETPNGDRPTVCRKTGAERS
jgi:hypothetical protein